MVDINMGYLYTVGGYATLLGLGLIVYHVSTQKSNRRGATSANRSAKAVQPEPRKEDKKKKQRLENFASEAQEAARAKAREPPEEPKPDVSYAAAAAAAANGPADDGDDVDNREFARQLAKAKEGTQLSSKSDGSKQREKSVKQSRANQMSEKHKPAPAPAPEPEPEAPLSTTSADADDDQSPATSPETRPADATGVSDMLEPTPAGPSVLRITDSEPKAEQKKKAAKAPEKVETKKQRQNRKKAEAAKAAREEAEKERKALEEKQRRAARIAEGRAAKDGSEFVAAHKADSAWSHGAPLNGAGAGASTKAAGDAALVHEPLDTFEGKPATAAPKTAAAKSEGSWISSLPSEEEQMEMLKDDADEWSTVETKASKRAKKASSVSSSDDKAAVRPAAQPQQAAPAPAPAKASKPASSQSFGGSFSALTTNDDAADEAEEEGEV